MQSRTTLKSLNIVAARRPADPSTAIHNYGMQRRDTSDTMRSFKRSMTEPRASRRWNDCHRFKRGWNKNPVAPDVAPMALAGMLT